MVKRDTAVFKACFSCTESFQHRAGAQAEVRGTVTKNVPAGTFRHFAIFLVVHTQSTQRKNALRYIIEMKRIEDDCRNIGTQKRGRPELWNSHFGKSHLLGTTRAHATDLAEKSLPAQGADATWL